jgi:electron transport complex protein RnfG
MKNNSSFTKPIFTLILICGFATAIVAGVYSLSKETILETNQKNIALSYLEVFPLLGTTKKIPLPKEQTNSIIKELLISSKNEKINGYIYTVVPKGYNGEISIMVGFKAPDKTITGVKILSNHETPGLGANCSSPSFLDQFKTKSTKEALVVSKQAQAFNEIQAITGATITSRAVTKGINEARAHLIKNY